MEGVAERCDDAGNCHLNAPVGDALEALSGSSESEGWAVGHGVALHWDGSAWTATDVPLGVTLRAVWSGGPDVAFAAGEGGVALRWDGSRWAALETGTTEDLTGISGSSASDVWAVGPNVALHWDGVRFLPAMNGWVPPVPDPIYRIPVVAQVAAFAPGAAFVHTSDGCLRWDGTFWTPLGCGGGWSVSISASGPNDIWVVNSTPGPEDAFGDRGHFDGTAWTWENWYHVNGCTGLGCGVGMPGGSGPVFTFGPGDAWVEGFSHFDGSSWTYLPNNPPLPVMAGLGHDLIGTDSQVIRRIDMNGESEIASMHSHVVALTATKDGALVAGAEDGTVLFKDRGGWTTVAPPFAAHFGPLFANGPDDVWFGGAHWNGTEWTEYGDIVDEGIAFGPGEAVALSHDVALRWTGSGWEVEQQFGPGDGLLVLTGTRDDLWALGSTEAPVHPLAWRRLNGVWRRVYEGTDSAGIVSAASPATGVVRAVETFYGAPSNRVLGWNGSTFVVEAEIAADSIAAAAPDDFTTFGRNHTTGRCETHRFDGRSWTEAPGIGICGGAVAIARGPTFALGSGGALWRSGP